MNVPIVLDVTSNVIVIAIGQHEGAVRSGATDGHGEEKVFVIDHAIAVAVLIGKVLHKLNTATLEYAEKELVVEPLELSAETKIVATDCPVDAVVPLKTVLPRLLRHAERGAVGHRGEIELRPGNNWVSRVKEVVHTETEAIHDSRTEDASP